MDEIDDFLDGPLVVWVKSCLGDCSKSLDYNDLVDGVILYQILLQIDPEPTFSGVTPSQGNSFVRIRNLEIILKNINNLYRDELNQLVIAVPNVVRLGGDSKSAAAKDDLKLLILLLLACAVQCPNKQLFIERIKELPLDVQHAIVHHIKQFTDTPMMVLQAEHENSVSCDVLLNHVRQLVKERDDLLFGWANATAGDSPQIACDKPSNSSAQHSESHHLAVELADWKSKLRKQRQELEEKTEAYNECKDELEMQRSIVARLRQELSELVQDARSAKAYRDELDVMREKADRAEKLHGELERYKAKMRDVEFFKTRVEELRDDNRVLMETREMLEGQLERARRRGDRVMDLESEILKLKQENKELALERDTKDRKLEEQYAEMAELQLLARCTQTSDDSEKVQLLSEMSGENSLSSQLTSNATTRALRLDLENTRLRLTIENLKESAVHEANSKYLEAEHQNKMMAIKVEQLEDQCKRLTTENKELELLVKDASQDLRKLQESREALRSAADTQQAELQAVREKSEVLQLHLNQALEQSQKDMSNLDELKQCKQDAEKWQEQAKMVPDLERKLAESQEGLSSSEAQVAALQKDVVKFREIIEEKHAKLDEVNAKLELVLKEKEQLTDELKCCKGSVARMHEVENERDDVQSRYLVSQQALETLQTELVQLKVNHRSLESGLRRLGLDPLVVVDPNVTLASLLSMPELRDHLPSSLREECKQCTEIAALREEMARYQVLASTLQSQINSLTAQHTAVQLANTQLAAEKEQLEEERQRERADHGRLLEDQTSLQNLHEQLSSEHETMVQKQETLRQQVRTQQREIQTLRSDIARQQAAQQIAHLEREQLAEKTTSLKNLRDEHAKLKSDFRELFTGSLHLKEDYKQMQTEFRKVKAEASQLQMVNSKLREESTALMDTVKELEMQLERLAQANAIIERDRRSVMDHATSILAQYQELFTHSIEDTQHYHEEEKHFVDKVNELRRQKEKLEEKIMDQYRRADGASSKKKGFGATLVRKVRKAGSDLMNRSRRSLYEDSRTSMNIQGSESGENDSDMSCDDAQRDDSGPLPRMLKQQGAGTRQTVYEAEGGVPRAGVAAVAASTQPAPSSLLVINRLNSTTVVSHNGPASPNLSVRSQAAEDPSRKSRKDDIYFDYGCV